MKEKVTLIANVNNVAIQVIQNGEKRIPIKPICEALGISHKPQYEKIKSHPILSSTVMLSMTVAADENDREMLTIPYKYIFGWLFSIDARNVKPEAAEAVLKYQNECYNVLYEHFVLREKYLEEQNAELTKLYEELDTIKDNFKACRKEINEKQKEISIIRLRTFEDWRMSQSQTTIQFPQTTEG